MLNVYINYPNPHIEIHADTGCGLIRPRNKQDQRIVDLEVSSLSLELQKFMEKVYSFGPGEA